MSSDRSVNAPPVIAVDAMGGDKGPRVVVAGVLASLASRENRFLIFGDESEIRAELEAHGRGNDPLIEVIGTTDVITMHDAPVEAVREKSESSLVRAARAVREGKASALLSPGNTGAVLAAGTLLVGRIRGVERPAIATVMPTRKGHSVLIDVGANVDSRATHLLHFGIMGLIYAKTILGLDAPRVGLLSIGEERTKGNELTQEALPLFEELFGGSGPSERTGQFIGNVEGRDIVNGKADVVVCDGFVGNVILKFGEGLAFTIMSMLRERITANPVRRLAGLLLRGAFREFKKRIDYAEYGGAPLLGVKKPCIICHGSSNVKAIKNAVRVAREALDSDICGRIEGMVRDFEENRKALAVAKSA